MAEEKELFLIDVDKIISEKAGDKAKFIPKFVNNWLKKILHQEDVNAFIGGMPPERWALIFSMPVSSIST